MFNRVKSLLALTVLATFGFASVATADEIVRTGEGRNFYNNISIPRGRRDALLKRFGRQPHGRRQLGRHGAADGQHI